MYIIVLQCLFKCIEIHHFFKWKKVLSLHPSIWIEHSRTWCGLWALWDFLIGSDDISSDWKSEKAQRKGRPNWKSKGEKTWRSKVPHVHLMRQQVAAERVNVPCLHLHSINHGPFAEKLSAKEALKTDRHSLIALLAIHQNTSCESFWPDMNGYRTSCFFVAPLDPFPSWPSFS